MAPQAHVTIPLDESGLELTGPQITSRATGTHARGGARITLH